MDGKWRVEDMMLIRSTYVIIYSIKLDARRERINEINVLAQVHVNPEGSTLNFARECGTSSTTMKRILKDNHYYDYKFKPKYLQLLETQLEDALDHLPLRYVRNLEGFQQDGAGPHNAALVTQYLNNRFPNNWIGTHGPVAWPPRSPCLNPLDYFFWGYLKNKVYYTPCQNMAELRERLNQACRSCSPHIIRKAVDEMNGRILKCLRQNGLHLRDTNGGKRNMDHPVYRVVKISMLTISETRKARINIWNDTV
ncbi:hypothetical protein NQ315_013363 [Exocentrus adspersus]|uniref:Uncharacterized protein n=1 Tax=Exocentrus adspersus TaxID=1586481 RepID=A0AAV8VRY2_9CUCU|nr:hypothetical protein NQ315_013363 [Exocentrus adspersus]